MRLALLSNVTVDLLAGMVKKTNEVYLPAGFDTWQQEMIAPASGLYEYRPEAVVVLLHAGAYEWSTREAGCQVIDGWCKAFGAMLSNFPGIPVFVSSIDIPAKACCGAERRIEQALEYYLIERIEELHQKGAGIYILPVKDLITNLGRDNFYSAKMWYAGSMPYSMKGMAGISDLINRYVSAVKGMRRKCFALDLDNTLWGGVIGEDGVDGIVLSNHKEGARYYDTQKLLKKMEERGVILAILSKNNTEDVESAFMHPDMVLRHDDFAAEAVNWEPKSVNIQRLAAELNIGLDSFVFLDDNPAEREQMKAECPEVAVVEFPKDSSQLPNVVAKAYDDYFLQLEITGEDAEKTAMYQAEKQRRAEMSAALSMEGFLKNLEMTMYIHRMRPEEIKRVVQLVNKTNQFNLTTRRYSEEEVYELAGSGDIITVHLADKYGEQGLVAVLILKYEDESAELDTFLMSCRVMGRSVENEIMARVKKLLETKLVKVVRAAYIKSAKNVPVVDLFERLGFSLISEENGNKKYEAKVNDLPMTTGVFKNVAEDWT